MPTSPLVSIIVPVYNTVEFVEECIQSVLSQSYRNIELILVNDGSTDGSDKVCKKYEHLPNVLYVEQSNSGVVVARKRGVEEAHGEWIVFVDSDDMLLPNGVACLINHSENNDIVISRHLRSTLLLDAPSFYSRVEYLYKVFSITTGMSPWAKLFRRQVILESPLAFKYNTERAEDFLMNIAIAITNKKRVSICKEAVYYYRERLNSTVHSVPITLDFCWDLCNLADSIVENELSPQEKLIGGIEQRLYQYRVSLFYSNYQGDKNHPFVRDLVRRMNEAKVIRLGDRLILSVSNRTAMRICLFISKLFRRLEQPSLIIRDCRRILHRK